VGSGDASRRFLSFTLAKWPLTFVPESGSPNGVASTLEVRVDGIRWEEVPSFFGVGGDERVYTTKVEDDGKTALHFGGSPGAPVPTGRNNILATYRQGLGEEGNVPARSLTTLLTRPTGLKAVVNPGPAEGGSPAETLEQARINVPSSVQTLGRIVSLRDFEDMALGLAVVAKARAYVDWDGDEQAVFVIVAGSGGGSLGGSLRDISESLDALRDVNRKMNVQAHAPWPIELSLDIIAHDDYLLESVQSTVEAALTRLFAFETRGLGQPVFMSDIYGALHALDGVVAVDLDVLRPREVAGSAELADVSVPPHAIATLDRADLTLRVAYGSF
jgi:predicted phage baseplate assembly protein